MLNAVKKMNAHQNKIPIAGFDEVKFEPEVLRSKTSLNPATLKFERHPAPITKRDVFAGEVGSLRRGSEGVSSFGPLIQSFRPRLPRSLKNRAKRLAGESEMESRK
jgi:hypothetical protein